MKHAENKRQLLQAMNTFSAAYHALNIAIDEYEQHTGESVNNLPGFTESYPFDKSFDELDVDNWVTTTVEKVKQSAYKVLNYTYLNTGGNTMVGIFEVWLPAEKRVAFALANEEGCNLSVVDYISNNIEVDDYDEFIIDYVDWGRVTGHEKYFELYRYCLNEYTKDDCRYFGITRGLPYHLLSDELQRKVDADYVEWCATENGGMIDTNGVDIIVSPSYEEIDEPLKRIKEFKRWHDTIAGDEKYYGDLYELSFAGHKVALPFFADIWNAIDTALQDTIENW